MLRWLDDFRPAFRALGEIAEIVQRGVTLTGGEPESVEAASVSPNFFTLAGIRRTSTRGHRSVRTIQQAFSLLWSQTGEQVRSQTGR